MKTQKRRKRRRSQREYLAHPNHCPYCGSGDIQGHSITVEGDGAYQPVTCNNCEARYHDHYQLTGYTPKEE